MQRRRSFPLLALLLPGVILLATSHAQACGMAFPAFGIYSGGEVTIYKYFRESFFLLLAGAILVKAIAYGFLAKGNFLRLFGAMVLANVFTTVVGFGLKVLHEVMLYTFLIPAFLAFKVFYFPVKELKPTGLIRFLGDCEPSSAACRLSFLFVGVGILGLMVPGSPESPGYWAIKYAFSWCALWIALIVTTGYELGIIATLRKEATAYEPVVKANLLVFLVLFVFETGALLCQGDLLKQ